MTRDEARRMIGSIVNDLKRGEVPYTINQARLEEMYADLDAITASQHKTLDGDIFYTEPWDCKIVWPQEVYESGNQKPEIKLISPFMAMSPQEFADLAPHAEHFELQSSNDPERFNLTWYYADVIVPQK